MPARAPDTITDEREQQAWYEISRVYEDFCGGSADKRLWDTRTRQFQGLLNKINRQLDESRKEGQ